MRFPSHVVFCELLLSVPSAFMSWRYSTNSTFLEKSGWTHPKLLGKHPYYTWSIHSDCLVCFEQFRGYVCSRLYKKFHRDCPRNRKLSKLIHVKDIFDFFFLLWTSLMLLLNYSEMTINVSLEPLRLYIAMIVSDGYEVYELCLCFKSLF